MAGRLAAHIVALMNTATRARNFGPVVRRCIPAGPRRFLRHFFTARAVRVSPDRIALEQSILPQLLAGGFGRVLSVGVERYTAHYPALFARAGVELWTLDIEPYHARWGEPGRHLTGDVRALSSLFPPARFDAVVFNGIIGFGVNEAGDADQAIQEIGIVLKPGGWLIAGWNVDKEVDLMALPSTHRLFRRWETGPLPSHVAIAGTTHVYDHLVREAASPSSARPETRGAAPASSLAV